MCRFNSNKTKEKNYNLNIHVRNREPQIISEYPHANLITRIVIYLLEHFPNTLIVYHKEGYTWVKINSTESRESTVLDSVKK